MKGRRWKWSLRYTDLTSRDTGSNGANTLIAIREPTSMFTSVLTTNAVAVSVGRR